MRLLKINVIYGLTQHYYYFISKVVLKYLILISSHD